MPKEARKFVNPLTQPTSTNGQPETHQVSTDTFTYTSTDTALPSDSVTRRKRGAQAFEKTHERITLWIDRQLKAQFEELAESECQSKTVLLNEAVADLLKKHGK